MNIAENLHQIKAGLPSSVQLVAVSKFHPSSLIENAYEEGQRLFGESRVQELVIKYNELPKDIKWHFIGHLQINKIKYIASFIDTVQSVDSFKLLEELNKFAQKYNRKINMLLQLHIAEEEYKYGFSYEEAEELFRTDQLKNYPYLCCEGLMGMATFTDENEKIRKEFSSLKTYFDKIKKKYFKNNPDFKELSMGMSNDYLIAIQEGSTMIRIGSKLFGER